MSSNINLNNIDTAYPVAGQDNDSQGFRDNFTNTNTNFGYAKEELEDLQSKVVLKEALNTGDPLDNDFNGNPLHNAITNDMAWAVNTIGGVSLTVNIDVSIAPYQTIQLAGNTDLSFSNWPTDGAGVIRIEVEVNDISVADTLTVPNTLINIDKNRIKHMIGNTIVFPAVGTYIYEFTLANPGTEISIVDLTPTQNITIVPIPSSNLGVVGDIKGMVALQNASKQVYICFASYTDGVLPIWARSAAYSTAW